MTKRELLKALGWGDDLILAFEAGNIHSPEMPEVDLDLEADDTSATEMLLQVEIPILRTNWIID
jgi:hypothetical protein